MKEHPNVHAAELAVVDAAVANVVDAIDAVGAAGDVPLRVALGSCYKELALKEQ